MGNIVIIGVILVLLGLGVFLVVNSGSENANNADQTATFTPAQVSEHNSGEDCWLIIEDKVYDVTEFIPRHPGGERILMGCGIDATSLFTERTTVEGEQVGTGTPHSSSAELQLSQFYIGDLTL